MNIQVLFRSGHCNIYYYGRIRRPEKTGFNLREEENISSLLVRMIGWGGAIRAFSLKEPFGRAQNAIDENSFHLVAVSVSSTNKTMYIRASIMGSLRVCVTLKQVFRTTEHIYVRYIQPK